MTARFAPFNARPKTPGDRRAFSITELLVVMGIIAVLVTLLLVALGGATDTARRTQATSIMNEFSKACEQFQLEHNRYPGIVPDTALDSSGGPPPLSGTELALLDLMGGYAAFHPTLAPDADGSYAAFGGTAVMLGGGWEIKIDVNLMGEGPVIGGKSYTTYFSPRPEQWGIARGQMGPGGIGTGFGATDMPDLLDPWGQPIVYVRQLRPSGPLADWAASGSARYLMDGMTPYIHSTQLGELGLNQTSAANGSIWSSAPDPKGAFAQIIRNPAFGVDNDPLGTGEPRGKFAIFSAGKDGVYYARTDGPGTQAAPVDDIVALQPAIVDEYDDIRVFGGG